MKRTLLLAGAAVAIVTVGAYAHAEERRERREIRIEEHIERIGRIDANSDGFVTRAEAQAEAERAFGDLDSDDNNKLDSADRGRHRQVFVHRMGGRKGEDRDVRVIVRDGEKDSPTVIERREVRVHEGGRKGGDRPPHPPGPPRAPMSMMMLMNSDEADRNGDGALSKEEFVAQQLRFFDASDANGDGKVKFERPPAPPEAPEPPTPPQPPRR